MCLLDYSGEQTTEPGEEAAERVADWEHSRQSGGIRLQPLVRQTQCTATALHVYILPDTIMKNADTLSS